MLEYGFSKRCDISITLLYTYLGNAVIYFLIIEYNMASFVEGEMDYKFKPIDFKGSPKQVSRLRNGHKVRIKPAMKGEGVCLMVSPAKYSIITKSFGRGKGVEIALDPDEILQNQQAAMEGRGIFSKISGAFKKAGKSVAGAAKTVGNATKKVVKTIAPVVAPIAEKAANVVIDKAVKYAPELAASALTGLAIAAGQPELVPLAAVVGKELGKEAGKAGGKAAKKQTKKTFGKKDKKKAVVAEPATDTQSDYMKFLDMMKQETGSNAGFLERAGGGDAELGMLQGKVAKARTAQMRQSSAVADRPELVFNSSMIGNKPLTANWVGGIGGEGLYAGNAFRGKGIYTSGDPVGSGVFAGYGMKKTTGLVGAKHTLTSGQHQTRQSQTHFENHHQQLPTKLHKGGVF